MPAVRRRIGALGLVAVAFLLGAFLVAPGASAAAGTSQLRVGERLNAGQGLTSPSGKLSLIMQGDGNLVLYAPGGSARWSSGTAGHPGAWAQFNPDGNFVVYGPGATPLWHTFAAGGKAGGTWLQLQDDGNLVQYKTGAQPTWQSGTFYFPARLNAQGTLLPGQNLQSPNGRFLLKMETTGNFVLYGADGQWIWHTNTFRSPVTSFVAQADGNMVLYTATGHVWASGTSGTTGGFLQVQDDGNVVFYTPSASPIWNSFAATNIVKRTGGGVSDVSGQVSAQQLIASPRLAGTVEAIEQIRAVANGTTRSHVINGTTRYCILDPNLLRTLRQMVVDEGNSVNVSSFNRFCTNTLTDFGPGSLHYAGGGGHAVDLGSLNGAGDANQAPMIAFAQRWVNIVPKPAGIGQSNCRPAGSLVLPAGVIQFPDACNHLHLEYRG